MDSVELWFSDSEEDDDERARLIDLARERRKLRDSSNPLELEEQIFLKNFRLPKAAFSDLLSLLGSKLQPGVRKTSVPTILKLAATLRFCAQGSYQLSVENESNIGLGQSTVSLVLAEVFKALEEHLCRDWITFHYTDEEKRQAKLYFFEKSGIPGVIGCIDGTHIKIVAPKNDLQHLYYNRKGYFSLNAMIVCDNAMRIRCINARYPGATHDANVFNMSILKQQLEDDYRRGERNILLGDAGYALKPYMLTPYRNPEAGSAECMFNRKHSQGRNIVERTIGVFKNRFRCLLGSRALHYEPKKATQIINVCAALHNICISYNAQLSDEEINDYQESNDNHQDNTTPESGTAVNEEGRAVRNNILQHMLSKHSVLFKFTFSFF